MARPNRIGKSRNKGNIEMKYIIKNCECFYLNVCCGTNTNRLYCKDITDCVMKQIVKNLKTCLQDNTCNNCDGVGYYDGCKDIKCGDYQARKSLELLEIEEVDEN